MTAYARTKHALEKAGYLLWRTEVWNQWSRKRIDLFNAFDAVAIKSTERGVLGVQPTVGDKVSAHLIKLLENPAVRVWLEAGNRAEIHGWRKVGERGKRKLWACRTIRLELNGGNMVPVYEEKPAA